MQDEELIMRLADGELEAEQRKQAEARMAADPAFLAAVERQRALRRTLGAAFDPVLREPIPERLLDAVRSPGAEVVTLAERRAPRVSAFGRAHWGALAATLAIGVFAGQFLQQDRDGLIGRSGERLVAQGELADALTARLAAADGAAPIRIALSFRARDGVYCRTFEGAEQMAGVACREGDAWAIRMAVREENPGAQGGYRMAASGGSPAVLTAVEGMIDGEPLNAVQEARAKARGWTLKPDQAGRRD